jgi:hypothetical protein
MKVKVPVWDALAGLTGPHPLPLFSPSHRAGAGGEGGELLHVMGRVLPGHSGRGVNLADLFGWQEWHLISAGQSGDSFRRTKMAGLLGGSIWRHCRAGQFGKSIQRVFLKRKRKRIIQESKVIEKKSKACIIFCRPVILHHVDTVYKQVVSLSYSAVIFQVLQNRLCEFS